VHQPWIDRQWKKAVSGLNHLSVHLPKIGKKLHGGHFALAATLGYLDLRFKGPLGGGSLRADRLASRLREEILSLWRAEASELRPAPSVLTKSNWGMSSCLIPLQETKKPSVTPGFFSFDVRLRTSCRYRP
jgi:hypothetical protein